jgi:hypothetical protein
MATLYSPSRAFRILLRHWWRRVRCPHIGWQPFEACPACGKEIR